MAVAMRAYKLEVVRASAAPLYYPAVSSIYDSIAQPKLLYSAN
jgi:hypothetical protein